jgi:formylglycine-generating enzyme
LDLQHSIIKAISVTTFCSLALAPDRPKELRAPSEGIPARAGDAAPDAKARADGAGKAGAADQGPTSCPAGMILVEGEHCPEAVQKCLKWLDPPPYHRLRCGEYAQPVTCKGARRPMRFCIDREEYAEPGAADPQMALPIVNKSWTEAQELCAERGARLCKESEWELACEGPSMSPYPYGFSRDSNVCNKDRTDLGGAQQKLTDHRQPPTAFPACVSPFGVHNMVGNVDEWVERENARAPNRSALRGGWWLPGRNRCRAATLGHTESYRGKQVGFRCCSEATR